MTEDEDSEAAADMNLFLQRHAIEQAKKGVSRTYILRDESVADASRVIGYYAVSVGHLVPDDIPKVVSPRMTIPVFLLLRLAIDKDFQGKGYGGKLFVHVLRRLVGLSKETGIYALVLDPLNEHVRAFYEKFGLGSLPGDMARMFITVRDIEAWISQTSRNE
jgi:GNAT superfamily N-acetyltransferase